MLTYELINSMVVLLYLQIKAWDVLKLIALILYVKYHFMAYLLFKLDLLKYFLAVHLDSCPIGSLLKVNLFQTRQPSVTLWARQFE